MRRGAALASLALALSACSPVYVFKSAAGHARLLWRRQAIAQAAADPGTPEPLRAKLRLVLAVREFAFGRMGLERSRDFSTYARVDGPHLNHLVSACRKTRFEPYIWSFPFIGSFPYRGYFDEEDARRERRRLEEKGWDAAISRGAAYNTPLWVSDPLPSSALELPEGELVELLLHELAHGTVFFKDRVEFNESLAVFVGRQGAREFLVERFGEGSEELKAYRDGLESQRRVRLAMSEVHGRLSELYASQASEQEKLLAREKVFAWGLERLKEAGLRLGLLNNAVVMAHRLYNEDLSAFSAAHRAGGGDWAKTMALLRSLDPEDPMADLRARLGS